MNSPESMVSLEPLSLAEGCLSSCWAPTQANLSKWACLYLVSLLYTKILPSYEHTSQTESKPIDN